MKGSSRKRGLQHQYTPLTNICCPDRPHNWLTQKAKSDSDRLKEGESWPAGHEGTAVNNSPAWKYNCSTLDNCSAHQSVSSNIHTLPNVPRPAEPGQTNYRICFGTLSFLPKYIFSTLLCMLKTKFVFSFCIKSSWLCNLNRPSLQDYIGLWAFRCQKLWGEKDVQVRFLTLTDYSFVRLAVMLWFQSNSSVWMLHIVVVQVTLSVVGVLYLRWDSLWWVVTVTTHC